MRPKKLTILAISLLWHFSAMGQVPVKSEHLSRVLVDLERRAPADVKPLNNTLISAQVPGVISTVHVEVGQQVLAGDLLLEFDPTDYSLNLDQAEANLAAAKAQKTQADSKLERARQLLENQYISPDTLLDRETDVMVLKTQIQAAQVAVSVAHRDLAKCQVTAPFTGVVTERLAQQGSFIGYGNPLLRLVQIDRFEVDAELPAKVADSLTSADTIWFESQNQVWPLKLLRLSPVIESERRSRRARFGFTGEAPPVGRSGEVVWRVDRGLLPSGLVSRRNGGLGIFVNNNGVANFMPLPGAQEGRPVAVQLPLDTQIITLGRERLQDGDALSIIQ
jgi:RND family efflux transporter MFP subunit